MEKQLALIAELQASELRRFQTVSAIYGSGNPSSTGRRFSNLERAFNVLASVKFVGYPPNFQLNEFREHVCELICDYIRGDYIQHLSPPYQAGFNDARFAETWFDFTQLGLYLSLLLGNVDTARVVAEWISFDMQTDSGIEEVSPAINYLYESVCSLLRDESKPFELEDRFNPGVHRKYESCLAVMYAAIRSSDRHAFVNAVRSFDRLWPGNTKHAALHEIVSIEASVLCMLWLTRNDGNLDEIYDSRSLLFTLDHV